LVETSKHQTNKQDHASNRNEARRRPPLRRHRRPPVRHRRGRRHPRRRHGGDLALGRGHFAAASPSAADPEQTRRSGLTCKRRAVPRRGRRPRAVGAEDVRARHEGSLGVDDPDGLARVARQAVARLSAIPAGRQGGGEYQVAVNPAGPTAVLAEQAVAVRQVRFAAPQQ